MKTTKTKVTRNIEVPGQSDQERATTVTFREAENAAEMIEICGGDNKKALDYFNSGRWAELRTKVSNALAGKTTEQRSVDKMISAFKAINPALSDEQVRTIVLAMPGMGDAVAKTTSPVPSEIDDTYFDKEEKPAEPPAAA